MASLKRIALFILIAAAVIILSVNYKGNDVLKRGIVLGLGVDGSADGVRVTAEMISPGNGGEQVGTFTKTVSANGATVAEALQAIAEKSGKETSLGQCVVLVLGEEFVKNDFTSVTEYFMRSDSFKGSAVVCCCKGTAEQLLNSGATASGASMSIADGLKGQSKDVALPVSDMLAFARSQQELYKTGFLNYVEFQPSQQDSRQSSQQDGAQQGYFSCNKVAVFRENKLVGVLTQRETQGFALLSDDVAGINFAVKEQDYTVTLRAGTKSVKAKGTEQGVLLSVHLFVKPARTDSFGAGGRFSAKTDSEVTETQKQQVRTQALEMAQLFLQKQREWEFDLLGFHELYRSRYGSVPQVESMTMQSIPVEVDVTVSEK